MYLNVSGLLDILVGHLIREMHGVVASCYFWLSVCCLIHWLRCHASSRVDQLPQLLRACMHAHTLHTENGPVVLSPGQEVHVVGRSHWRGYLIVEHAGQLLHLPHHFTELRVS